jgi:hypothetical protein
MLLSGLLIAIGVCCCIFSFGYLFPKSFIIDYVDKVIEEEYVNK